jgi:hypothetical protein
MKGGLSMIKSLTVFDKYTEKENNATKSLIDLLRFSDVHLTELFITKCLRITDLNMEDSQIRKYDLQVGTKLLQKSGLGCIIAICDESINGVDKRVNTETEKETIPDALIQLNNVTLLIESKVEGSKINIQQLKDHEKKFADNELINPPIYISWQEIHAFLEELTVSKYSWNEVTIFLLEQYLAYSEHMGFTYEKKESYIMTYFINQPKVLNVISEIHTYLTRFNDVHFNKPITDCFGYTLIKSRVEDKIYKTNKFFTSTLYNKGTYVLHLTSAVHAEELQLEVDYNFKGNKKKNKRAPKEVHINMELVETFDQIKPYVDLAYHQRKLTIS